MILVDSSVWIDFLRGTDTPQRRMLHAMIRDDHDAAICDLVLTEVLQGIRGDNEYREVKECLQAFPCYSPVSPQTWLHAADIYRSCRRQGRTVRKTVDCIMAAICIENDLILLHSDRDFTVIETCTELCCREVE